MQINLASDGLNIVKLGLIYVVRSHLYFVKNRCTFMHRKISERVGGKLLTMSALGSEA